MKKFFSLFLCVLLIYALIESASFLNLRYLESKGMVERRPFFFHLSSQHLQEIRMLLAGKNKYIAYSSTLGWSLKQGGEAHPYQANLQGIRADRKYSLEPQEGVLRVSAFGDSFVHGDQVENKDTWEEKMMSMDPRLEVLNFGVGSYGVDQSFLRYKESGVRFKPKIVFIGFRSNNVNRSVNVFKPFLNYETGFPMTKPRFAIRDDQLIFVENPLPNLKDYGRFLNDERGALEKVGSRDYFYRTDYSGPGYFLPSVRLAKIFLNIIYGQLGFSNDIVVGNFYNPKSEAFLVTEKILDEFHKAVLKEGSTPLVLFFPGRRDMILHEKDGSLIYQPLMDRLKAKNIESIDLMDAFRQFGRGRPIGDFFNKEGAHYSSLGNEIVAEYLFQYLKAHS